MMEFCKNKNILVLLLYNHIIKNRRMSWRVRVHLQVLIRTELGSVRDGWRECTGNELKMKASGIGLWTGAANKIGMKYLLGLFKVDMRMICDS